MDRMRPCRWGARLFAVLVLAAVASPAGANETVYDQDGYKLVVGIHAALGGFTANSIDFGAGNVNSRAPLEGPFAPSQRRTDRQWFEGFGKPFAEIEMPFFGFGHAYGLVSAVGALTLGSGDPTSSLAPQGARSTTSDSPRHLALEDLVIGWHSGELFTDSLGEDAVEISGGRQSFVLGDAFLLGSGVANGFARAAVGLEPRTSFDRAAILKVNTAPLRVQLFHLESRTDQDLMRGFDPPKTKFVGVDLALFKPGGDRRPEPNRRRREGGQSGGASDRDDPGEKGSTRPVDRRVQLPPRLQCRQHTRNLQLSQWRRIPDAQHQRQPQGPRCLFRLPARGVLQLQPRHIAPQPVRHRAQRRRQSPGQRQCLVRRAGLQVFGAALDPATQPALRPVQRRPQHRRPGQAVL